MRGQKFDPTRMERLFTLKTPLRVSHFKLSRADACVAELLAELVAEEDLLKKTWIR